MVNLNQRILLELEVPIPPLTEQKRIADKLDAVLVRVNACRARLDHVSTILKRFRQAVLAAATSGTLTEEWRVTQGVERSMHTFEFSNADAFRDYVFPQSWGWARLSE
jgi:type I restriction enzyme S subunit